jgi:uncharacterized protein (DUF1697 family)
MTKYIALLRAINVGGHTVKMDHLKKLFEKMDFENVETFIASGNVFFESTLINQSSTKQIIEQGLEKELGYKVATFIRTTKELKAIAEYKPFKVSELLEPASSLYIAFLDITPSKDLQKKVLELSDETNEFLFNNKELYWLCRKNFSDSGISGKTLEKALGAEITVRNSTSIRKMIARFS